MRKRDAVKLANRDEVEVRVDGEWLHGRVLGEVREERGVLLIPVMGERFGYHAVSHRDVR